MTAAFAYSSAVGTPIVRGFNAGEDFTVSLSTRQTVVSSGGSSTTTTGDYQTTTYTSATIDTVQDLQLFLPLKLAGAVSFASSNTSILTVDPLGKVSRVADGTANVTVTVDRLGVRRFPVTVSRQAGQTIGAFSSFATGSLGKHLVDSLAAMLSGKTAPTFNGTGGASSSLCDIYTAPGVRNSAGWWGNVDLTCIPRNGAEGGVLITPLHTLHANHYGAGPSITFDDNAGNAITRTVTATQQIAGTDMLLATLNTALPSSITPAKLLPSTWATKLPNTGNGYPCVFTNQDRRLLIADTQAWPSGLVTAYKSKDATRAPWWYQVRSGDSGSPCGMIINGVYTQLTNWFGAGYGPRDSDYISQLNTAMTGSGYTVSTVNLSGFNTYP